MHRRTRRTGAAVSSCAALLLAVMLSACTTASSSPVRAVTVTVSPQTSLADQAVQIRVSGLAAGEQATPRVSSTEQLACTG
jgi:hypothetical protein